MTLACRLLGHRCHSYVYGHRRGRDGRMRDAWGTRCTRCGMEGPDCWAKTPIERLVDGWWRVRRAPRAWAHAVRRRWHRDCAVCGEPERRRGRRVGEHRVCDEVPF